MKRQSIGPIAGLVIAMAGLLGACDHGDGAGQKAQGQFESAAGSLTGNDKLKRDGKKDQVVGGFKNTVGDLKDTLHDAHK